MRITGEAVFTATVDIDTDDHPTVDLDGFDVNDLNTWPDELLELLDTSSAALIDWSFLVSS